MSELDITRAALFQLQWHWENQLRPRLDGLTDEEYLWEPVPGAWNIRPGEPTTIDFAVPEPDPAPVTTIAWRLGHVVVGVLAMRNANHFGRPAADYTTWSWAATADEALRQLDEQYAAWVTGVAGLDAAALAEPNGEPGPWSDLSMLDLVLHIHREVIHHGAEVSLLRDLYAHR
ncbi:DinB family protein [Mariniluteicoccus endophyticus]